MINWSRIRIVKTESGFTLAEVLITLMIIGVVAALTIPTLMSNTGDIQLRNAYRKMLSAINQAISIQMALDEGLTMDEISTKGGATAFASSTGFYYRVLMKRMQVSSTTSGGRKQGLSGTLNNGNAVIYLNDGTVIEMPEGGMKSTTCKSDKENAALVGETDYTKKRCLFTVLVDVNGDRGICALTTTGTLLRDCYPVNIYTNRAEPGSVIAREVMYGQHGNN